MKIQIAQLIPFIKTKIIYNHWFISRLNWIDNILNVPPSRKPLSRTNKDTFCNTSYSSHEYVHTFVAFFSVLNFSGEIDTVLSHRLTKVTGSETKSSHIHQHQENVSGILSSDNEPTTSKPNQVDQRMPSTTTFK